MQRRHFYGNVSVISDKLLIILIYYFEAWKILKKIVLKSFDKNKILIHSSFL